MANVSPPDNVRLPIVVTATCPVTTYFISHSPLPPSPSPQCISDHPLVYAISLFNMITTAHASPHSHILLPTTHHQSDPCTITSPLTCFLIYHSLKWWHNQSLVFNTASARMMINSDLHSVTTKCHSQSNYQMTCSFPLRCLLHHFGVCRFWGPSRLQLQWELPCL